MGSLAGSSICYCSPELDPLRTPVAGLFIFLLHFAKYLVV